MESPVGTVMATEVTVPVPLEEVATKAKPPVTLLHPSTCPPTPMPSDKFGRLGITNTKENPACCKLLVDLEAIGFDTGIFTPAK